MPRIVKRTTVTETFDEDTRVAAGGDLEEVDDDLAEAEEEATDSLRRQPAREREREPDRTRRR